MKRRLIPAVLALLIVSFACACGCTDMSNRDPIVTFTLDPNASSGIGGTFVMELFPDKAPNSVNYFINLIIEGYYNKFNVSQVHENAMVVFGDPWYQGGNNRVIRGEFADNGFMQNDVDFVRGTVGLSLDEGDPDSNYGDFFIILDDAAKDSMNGKFCAIGRVIEGLEILDEISRLQTSSSLKYQPYASVRTLTVTVDLKGRVYPTAETLDRKNKPGFWDE